MDMRGIDEDRIDAAEEIGADAAIDEVMFDLGGDERRMHVRAYNHWVSLLRDRPYPRIDDLDPASIADFGPNSVLLDFSAGIEDPGIAYLGKELREECGLEGPIKRIAEVPSRSLLSRLTDHYLQIIANRAPIGFEAEFIGTRGRTTLYRGILMPFSSTGEEIDFIYGVINWKEVADAATQALLGAELDAAVRAAPPASDAPVWADGPHATEAVDAVDVAHSPSVLDVADTLALLDADDPAGALDAPGDEPATLDDRLTLARESAAAVRAADTRSRAALYRALGRAHDFALAAAAEPEALAALLEAAGIAVQARAPLTPIVKLVFGADYDKTRVTEFACVLGHAARMGVRDGELPEYLEGVEGGIKAIVAEERRARRPAPTPRAVPAIGERPVLAELALPVQAETGEVVLLVARVSAPGQLAVVGTIADASLADRAVRALG